MLSSSSVRLRCHLFTISVRLQRPLSGPVPQQEFIQAINVLCQMFVWRTALLSALNLELLLRRVLELKQFISLCLRQLLLQWLSRSLSLCISPITSMTLQCPLCLLQLLQACLEDIHDLLGRLRQAAPFLVRCLQLFD